MREEGSVLGRKGAGMISKCRGLGAPQDRVRVCALGDPYLFATSLIFISKTCEI